MLEILVLIRLGRSIAARAKEKGRSGTAFVFLLLGLWFGGEIAGAIGGAIFSLLLDEGKEPNPLLIYAGAFLCASLGAVCAFKIVGRLAPIDSEYQDYADGDFKRLPKFHE